MHSGCGRSRTAGTCRGSWSGRCGRCWETLGYGPRRPRPRSCTCATAARASTSRAFTIAGCAAHAALAPRKLPGPLALTAGDAAAPRACARAHRAGPSALAGRASRANLNRFLRGWAGYFRYGNLTVEFDQIVHHADRRLALLIAHRHQRAWWYGRKVLNSRSDRCGLVDLNRTIIAPRSNRPWRG